MALLTGSNKINIAVFISGTGSNLKSLIKFSKLKKSPIIIKLIISNNSKAKGLQYANIYKIKKKVLDFKNTLSEKKVINELKNNDIHLICLAGFMKILSNWRALAGIGPWVPTANRRLPPFVSRWATNA